MSKIALRVYNREIEALTQEGHIDEAVAHCKHILKTFPKHLETYRLLGKAYLEGHDYDSATDIFQRVLTSAPDDFVSHLGMSIIADESKNLEQAIWHMERAFESIPSNGGVQAELRRLYGRRDGLEPPKIQLTRPALARMYIRGGKYTQAIQELKSVLQEEPDRLDIKIMMAQAHFRAGQKVEASEICNEILKISPYCFDANQILAEVLPGTSLESTLTTYKNRLQQLDPYLGLVIGSTFDLSTVKDAGITIERLDWDEALAQQAESGWNTTSAAPAPLETESSSESQEEAIPDWMKSQGWGPSTGEFQEGPLDFDEPESPAPAVSSGENLAAAEIPEWLKGMAPVGLGSNDSQPEQKAEEADLDWLSGISAASGITLKESEQASSASEGDIPDWLAGLGEEQPAAEQPETLRQAQGDAFQPQDDTPDWLAGLGEEQPSAQTPETTTPEADDDSPDWLAGLGEEQPAAETPETTTPESDADTPDWLAGLGEEQPVAEQPETLRQAQGDTFQPQDADTPDWLAGLSEEQPVAETPETTQPETLEQAQGDAFQPSTSPGTSEAEQDEAFKWLEMLAAGQGAKPEELLTQPEERLDHAPEWAQNVDSPAQPEIVPGLDTPQEQRLLDQPDISTPESDDDTPDWLAGLGEEQPVAETPETTTPESDDDTPDWLAGLGEEQPVAEQPETTQPSTSPGTSEAEQDEAFKWLEMLAAGQGAKPEELLTQSEERLDHAPEWAQNVDSPAQPEIVPGLDTPQEQRLLDQPDISTPESDDDTPDWLAGLGEEQPVAETPETTTPESDDDSPDWLAGLSEEQPDAEQPETLQQAQGDTFQPSTSPGTSEAEQDEAFKWLEMLAAGQGAKPEELLTQPEERLDHAPEWAQNVDSPAQPEIVPGLDTPQEQRLLDQPDISTPESDDDTPDWLAGLGEEQPVAEQPETTQPSTSPGTSEAEQDEAFKWLEMLAAGQGAKPEELLTQPEERLDHAPEWAQNVDSPAQPEIVPTPESDDDSPDWLAGLGEEQPAAEQPETTTPESDADTPDWLAGLGEEQHPVAEQPETLRQAQGDTFQPQEDDTPDWLAGLGEEQPAAETPETIQPETLQQVQGDAFQPSTSPGTSEAEQDEAFKWLEMLAAGQGAKPEELLTQPEERLDHAPEWAQSVDSPAQPEIVPTPEADDDSPDWLAGLGEEQPVAEQPETIQPSNDPGLDMPQNQRLLDQHSTIQPSTSPGTSEAEQDEAFKWLEMLAAGQGAKPEELLTQPEERLDHAPEWAQNVDSPAQPEIVPGLDMPQEQRLLDQPDISTPESDDDTPDWLAGLGEEQPVAEQPETIQPSNDPGLDTPQNQRLLDQHSTFQPSTSPGTSEAEQDEAFKWLEMLAAGQGAKPEELLTQPEERLDHAPEWAQNIEEETKPTPQELPTEFIPEPPIEVEDEGPIGDLSAPVSAPGTSEIDQDQAFKWLENLASAQGAKPEELLTQPEERSEQTPGWVEIIERPQTELSALISGPGTTESEQDESFKWLENLAAGQGAKPEELLTQPEERQEQTPEWVEKADESVSDKGVPDWLPEISSDQAAGGSVTETSSSEQTDFGVTQWLQSLEQEDLPVTPQASQISASADHMEDLPDWLKDEAADELPPTPMPVSGWVAEESHADSLRADDQTPETATTASAPSVPAADLDAGTVQKPEPAQEATPAPVLSAALPVKTVTTPPVRAVSRQTGMLGGDKDAMLLHRARLLLEKASLDTAMSEYMRLIKKGKYMEEIIFDLQEATYKHPVDVIIWQTLGDAYMRYNRLQEALDAYTKAEELLR